MTRTLRALRQPQVAAKAMLGQDVGYDRVPFFFTDQYDLGTEYVGYVEPDGYDQVVFRGHVREREFIAFYLVGGRVLAGMNVNVWDVTDQFQALVRSCEPADGDGSCCLGDRPQCPARGRPDNPVGSHAKPAP